MNKTFSIYNANSIMFMLMQRSDLDHINMTKGEWYIDINIFFDLHDLKVCEIREELEKVVTKNCEFEIRDYEKENKNVSFTTLDLRWDFTAEC